MAAVGTGIHRLYNTQPEGKKFIHNVTLLASGIKPVNRNTYCEVEVRGQHNGIIWGGSCDTMLSFGNNLNITDLKRFRHTVREQHGKVLQTVAYGLPEFEKNFKNGLFIAETIKRNVTSKSVKHRYPRTNMTLVGDEYIAEFKMRLELKQEFQSEVARDADVFFEEIKNIELKDKGELTDPVLKKLHRKSSTCEDCFSKNLCKTARKVVKDTGNVQSILDPKYSLKSC